MEKESLVHFNLRFRCTRQNENVYVVVNDATSEKRSIALRSPASLLLHEVYWRKAWRTWTSESVANAVDEPSENADSPEGHREATSKKQEHSMFFSTSLFPFSWTLQEDDEAEFLSRTSARWKMLPERKHRVVIFISSSGGEIELWPCASRMPFSEFRWICVISSSISVDGIVHNVPSNSRIRSTRYHPANPESILPADAWKVTAGRKIITNSLRFIDDEKLHARLEYISSREKQLKCSISSIMKTNS